MLSITHLSICLPENPIWLSADRMRLAQIFVIDQQRHQIYGCGRPHQNYGKREEKAVAVSIRDNGMGIPPVMLPRSLTCSFRCEFARTLARRPWDRLTLVKRLIELHEGKIEAHSEGQTRKRIYPTVAIIAAPPLMPE